MSTPVAAEDLRDHFEELEYPVVRSDAAVEFVDIVITDGQLETNLGELISDLDHDSFETAAELHAEVLEALDNSS